MAVWDAMQNCGVAAEMGMALASASLSNTGGNQHRPFDPWCSMTRCYAWLRSHPVIISGLNRSIR